MRGLKVLLTSLTILSVLCSQALAQSAPAASQYRAAASCPNGVAESAQETQAQAADVGDGACAAADNAGQGTDAVNDALTGTASSASAPAPAETPASGSAPAGSGKGEDAASASAGAEDENSQLASITELPETGGAPPVALALGAALLLGGLAARGFARR